MDYSKYNNEPEFQTALKEMFSSLDNSVLNNPRYASILEKIVEPDRIIAFDVNWVDDKGEKHTNKGYRVQFNNANGIYKGGLRFHPSVNLSILKFLAFEQTFKNYLTDLPMGGAKGGSDFDPRGKSDNEIKNFCYAFMKELYPYIGVNLDVPAGDIGVGEREIRYLFEAYKQYSGKSDCSLTGKPLDLGGSLCRPEATGYGLLYFAEEMLKTYLNDSIKGKRVIVSGCGKVASMAALKARDLGAIIVGMSNINGCVSDQNGLNVDTVLELANSKFDFVDEYVKQYPDAKGSKNSRDLWKTPCDIALPCATQFELNEEDAKILITNGCIGVFEGANMPCTMEAANLFISNKVLYSPGKASNAGGVAVSGLEIEQNKLGEKWSFQEVDLKLKHIMKTIFKNCYDTAKELGNEYDLIKGANNYAFIGVAEKMLKR